VFSLTDRPAGYEKTSFDQLSSSDFEQIIDLYQDFNQKYFFTLTRGDKEWSIIKEMKSIDVYIKRDLQGNIVKYFCVNKGRDLTSIIHEVSAKSENDFRSLLKDVEKFKLWIPESENSHFSSAEIFFTAFMKLGNEKIFSDFIKKVSNGELSITSRENQFINFKYKDQTIKATEQEFIQYVLGPRALEEFTSYKLSLYICGTDSI
jgi:hypothetical protein